MYNVNLDRANLNQAVMTDANLERANVSNLRNPPDRMNINNLQAAGGVVGV